LENKIRFSVDKYELLDRSEDAQFAKLRMYIVREGNNHHKLPISWEAIEHARDSLIGKPVLCSYNKYTDKFQGHEEDEIPVGVFLKKDEMYEEVIDSQRWLVADAYIWKMYSPQVISVLEKNDGESNISMEIAILESSENEEGGDDIDLFSFTGVTLIGVDPAIDGAKTKVIKFSEMVEGTKVALGLSEKYSEINFSIPDEIRENVLVGMKIGNETNHSVTSEAIQIAKYLKENIVVSPIEAKNINDYISNNGEDFDAISLYFVGGDKGCLWIKNIVEEMNKADDIYKALELNDGEDKEFGMDEKEKVGEEKKEKDNFAGKEEEKKEEDKEEMEKDEEKKDEEDKEKMEKEDEKKEEDKDKEEMEKDEEEAKEEDKDAHFNLSSHVDVSAYEAMLTNETEANTVLSSELKKNIVVMSDLGNLVSAMHGVIVEMFSQTEELKATISELQEFKKTYEEEKMNFEVESTLKDVSENGMPKDEVEKMREESKEYSLETVETWKNLVKAKAYSFSKEDKKEEGITRMAMPFDNQSKSNKKKSPWN